MRRFSGQLLSLGLLLFFGHSARADEYKFSVVPDKPLVTIDEGAQGLEHYTLANVGTKPFWVFTFSISRISKILPDPTDWAKPHYFGPDASGGIEVDPGETFEFGYQLTTPRRDRKAEHRGDPDFGLQTLRPNIFLDLREGPTITSPFLPKGSGTITAFDVKVDDPKTPEPTAVSLVGIGLAVLIGLRIASRNRILAPNRKS